MKYLISNICPCDIKEQIIVLIPRSKTDQLHQGDEVIIAREKSVTCLIKMLEQYLAMAKIPLDSQSFLFQPIVAGQTPRLCDTRKLSCSQLGKLLKEKSAVEFNSHSLRAGRATAAFKADVPDCIFKRHGKWNHLVAT